MWPKSPAPIVLQESGERKIEVCRWGVRIEIQGTKKPLTKFVTNARDDSLQKFTWRYSVAERRCLIPASSYFEPDGPAGAKWWVRFSILKRPMFFIAGVWNRDKTEHGGGRSFAMVTTSANDLAARIHDRMPLVLPEESALQWLGDKPLSADQLSNLCRPYAAGEMVTEELRSSSRKITAGDLSNAPSGELNLE